MLDSLTKNYMLVEKIGEGTFSQVHKARDLGSGHFVAVKRLLRPFASKEEVDQYPELRTLLLLENHPNILNLLAYVYEPEKQSLCLVFNLMNGSLYDFIKDRKRKLSENRCKLYLYQLAQGLSFLHQSGVFHRDIKPENILVRVDKQLLKSNPLKAELVQLGDFGSVASSRRQRPITEYVSTRWYRSPECILTAGNYGPKMDVWALGCCFYEMLSLQPLFAGESEFDQLEKIHSVIGSPSDELLRRFKRVRELPRFPKKIAVDWYELLPTLSYQCIDVLKRMLIYHPDQRISSKKLLEHIYFNELRQKMPVDSISSRIAFGFSSPGLHVSAHLSSITTSLKNSQDSTHGLRTVLRSKSFNDGDRRRQQPMRKAKVVVKDVMKSSIANNIRESLKLAQVSLNEKMNRFEMRNKNVWK